MKVGVYEATHLLEGEVTEPYEDLTTWFEMEEPEPEYNPLIMVGCGTEDEPESYVDTEKYCWMTWSESKQVYEEDGEATDYDLGFVDRSYDVGCIFSACCIDSLRDSYPELFVVDDGSTGDQVDGPGEAPVSGTFAVGSKVTNAEY